MPCDRRFWTAIGLGFAGLWVSTLRFDVVIESTRITLHWGFAFPLLVALMYGARYGVLSGLLGLGGFFPFLLWPGNGYANIASVIAYILLYGAIGYFAELRKRNCAWWNHIVFIGLASALLWSLLIYLFYPPLIALNPPVWNATAATSIASGALQAIATKGFVNVFAIIMVVTALHKTNTVRRFFGLPVVSWAQRNEHTLALCFAAGAVFWLMYILFVTIFVTGTFPYIARALYSPDSVVTALVFFVVSAICAVILMEYNEKQLKLQEINTLALQELNHYKENLEIRVEERTAALRTANSSLEHTIQELNEARNQVVQSEKLAALGSLVAGIAHELNTPIGNAVTVASTLHETQRDFQHKMNTGVSKSMLDQFVTRVGEGSDILMRNLECAANLVSSFKQVAVDQSNHQRRPFQLSAILSEVAIIMAPGLRKAGVNMQLRCDPAAQLDSYPGALTQALMIVINNAVTHAFENRDSGNILIDAVIKTEQLVEITVADDGVGLDSEALKRIYEPFYTTKLGKGGSGLGLHIFYNLVTATLGGKTEAESSLGKGLLIRMVLPVSAPATTLQNSAAVL